MAGLTPIVSSALPIVSMVQRQETLDQQRSLLVERQQQQLEQLQASQQLEMQSAQADAANRAAQLKLTAATDEKQRRDALRKAVAKSRVSLAGQGVDPASGSGEALLLGLVNQTDQDSREADAAYQLRAQALDQQLADQNRLNLLEQSQLADRQRLQLLSRYY
ncbi:MAG: hypothetical protein GC191_05745 [Azospirillum sp.]|nr:hypothetical protein [Azospirillum sp.]